MGRFIGLTKNKGSGLSVEDPDFENSGLILTSNGTGFVLAAGASLDRDPIPDYLNANESLNVTLSVTGAFGNTSSYTFGWRDGAQFGLSLSSSGTLSGAASSMSNGENILKINVTDTEYDVVYESDITIFVSTANTYPDITTNNNNVTLTAAETFTFSVSGTPTEWAIITRGNLPGNVTIDNNGIMTFPGKASDETTTTYNFTLGVRNASMPATAFRTTAFSKQFYFEAVKGQQQYEGAYGQNGGQCSYTWVAPAGVERVSVLAIGAGGGGRYDWATCGGHGGATVWANDIPVVPGNSYEVKVGRGGCWNANTGGCSCWPGMKACGGCCGCYGGCYSHSGTGAQGTCCAAYGMPAYDNTAGGGGGAAGYGGNANANRVTSGHRGCCGGGGSAASHHSSTHGTGGGGGTGSCGMCCYANGGPYGQSCGKCSWQNTGHGTSGGSGQGGSGGNCGKPGEPYSNGRSNGYACGGLFGGGGGGGGTSRGGGWGGPGVVRIIWGSNRAWPCCNTHNL